MNPGTFPLHLRSLRRTHAIVPGRFGPGTTACCSNFDQVRLSFTRHNPPAVDRRFELLGVINFLSAHTLTFRQHHKINVRLAQIGRGAMSPGCHPALVTVIHESHRLIIAAVGDNGQNRNVVTSLGPESCGAVHHRAVADETCNLAVWRSNALHPLPHPRPSQGWLQPCR
jgi:hypothetical protein